MEYGFKIPRNFTDPELPEFDRELYTKAADWANNNNARIVEYEEYYTVEENPPPPEMKSVRIFSKYKLCDATIAEPFTLADGTQTTVWEAFKSFITAAGKKDLWDNIVEVAEDNRHFQEAVPVAIENFGEALVNQVLSASVERVENHIIKEGE